MSADKKHSSSFRGFIQWLDTWLAEIAGWLVIIMMLTISYDVFMRYAFGAPTKWSLEINEYLLLAVVYLSGAWALPAGGHVRVDIVYKHFSPTNQARIEIFLCILSIMFTAVLTWEGILFVHDGIVTWARSETYLEILQWPIRLLTVIGSGFLCLEFVFRLFRYIRVIQGKEESTGQEGGL